MNAAFTPAEPSILKKAQLDVVAGAALVLFAVALVSAGHWDAHPRQLSLSSLSTGDLIFDSTVIVSTGAAAYILPLSFKVAILMMYAVVTFDDLIEKGPTLFFQILQMPGGTAHDVFFWAQIFLLQTVLLAIFGATLLIRNLYGK